MNIDWILALPKESAILTVAILPIFELRGAIPLGISLGLPSMKVFFISLLGNLLPVLPLLLFFKYFFDKLKNIRFFKWWFFSIERRSRVVNKWGFWGLVLFVAIPFPGTGAWTGSAAAILFNFKLLKALLAISLGVLIAGILVTLGSVGIVKL